MQFESAILFRHYSNLPIIITKQTNLPIWTVMSTKMCRHYGSLPNVRRQNISPPVWELLSTLICKLRPTMWVSIADICLPCCHFKSYKHVDFTATCQLSVDKMYVYQLKFLLSPIFDRFYVFFIYYVCKLVSVTWFLNMLNYEVPLVKLSK